VKGGVDPQRDGDENSEDHRKEGERDRDLKPGGEKRTDRDIIDNRPPQVSPGEVPDVSEKLQRDGSIQSQFLSQDLKGFRSGMDPQNQLGRVSREDDENGKDQDGNKEERHEEDEKAFEQEGSHTIKREIRNSNFEIRNKFEFSKLKDSSDNVIPVKTGIQKALTSPDSGVRRSDEMIIFRGSLKLGMRSSEPGVRSSLNAGR